MQKALDIFQEITQALLADEQKNPVAEYIPSEVVYDKLDLRLTEEGTDMEQFKSALKGLVLATPKTATNAFFNQLFGGRNETAVLGDLLAVVLNNSMYTYKAGGPMIAIEKEIIRNICNLLGWDGNSEGTLAAGGSMTNYKGILMARAYCGSALFSDKYRHLIKGADRADSFTVNAHKMLGTPLSCSIIVVKDKKHMYDSFTNDASYLYQTHNDDFNPGKISLQCGRRNDALKFWALWKSIGTKGLGELVDKQFHLGEVARNYIRSNDDYTLYSFDESIGICYNYKGIPAREICTALYEKSELMVGYGSFHGTEFIRFVTINYGNDEQDILNYFKQVEEFVEREMG